MNGRVFWYTGFTGAFKIYLNSNFLSIVIACNLRGRIVQKKQFFTNSCGAASLLCVAHELGVRHLPNINVMGSMSHGQALAATNNCESAIYQITSGSTTGQIPHGNHLSTADYSMPDKMVFAARLLDLDAQIYLESGAFASALGKLYSSTVEKCEQSGVPIHRTAPPQMGAFERMIKIVGVLKVVGLHYVMKRPDGTYMDPGDGQNFPDFDQMNNSWLKCYSDTGISIVCKRQANNSAIAKQALKDFSRRKSGQSHEAPF